MNLGDILYSNVFTSPLVVMVRRGDGQFFDFKAGAFALPPKPFSVAQFSLAMTPDAFFPTTQRCVILVAATKDPQAELIEAMLVNNSPEPTQSFWIGGTTETTGAGAGVPIQRATGCVAIVRFT